MEFYPKDDLDTVYKELGVQSEIQKVYSGSCIFLTGSTGFVGKCILEKLIRSCNISQVYILVRKKKGKTSTQRLEQLLNDVVFERMLIENKNARNLITPVEGDLTLPDIGLSPEDLQILHDKVQFVFHSAATVNMEEHIRTAFYTNVNATHFLLEQAKLMAKLKAFIYVSTAFSQVMLSNIKESFYAVDFSAEELERIVKCSDDDQLTALTPLLISKWENTYSFTKAITENLVSAYYPHIPVAVARPSIIMPTVSEPLAGWIDNMYGTTGVTVGCGFGILKVWRCDPHALNDMIPVDIVVNSILSIGWYISSNKPQPVDNIMFNLVSCKKKPISTEKYMKIVKNICFEDGTYPSLIMGTINLKLVKNEMLFWFYFLFLHVIPGLLFDAGLRIFGQSPILMRIYRKAYRTNNSFASYITKEFNFSDTNVHKLWDLMNPMDRKLFNFDQDSYTYKEYYSHVVRGLRVYLLKDPMETVPQARRRYKIILYLNSIFKMALYVAVGWFVAYIFLQWF